MNWEGAIETNARFEQKLTDFVEMLEVDVMPGLKFLNH